MSTVAYWQNGYSDAKVGKGYHPYSIWNDAQIEAYHKGYQAGTATGDKQAA